MQRRYTTSKDTKSGLYYAHMKSYPYIPVSGSCSTKQSEAREYAKMMDYLPNKVEQIEEERRKRFLQEIGG